MDTDGKGGRQIVWSEVIASGTEFGNRAEKAIAAMNVSMNGVDGPSSLPGLPVGAMPVPRAVSYAPIAKGAEVSRIGTRLGEIFRLKVGAVSCGPCAAAIRSLDKMTVEQVREKEDEIVAEIASRAQKNMPNWWKKLLVKVDQTLHMGVTEHLIREYLREACRVNDDAAV